MNNGGSSKVGSACYFDPSQVHGGTQKLALQLHPDKLVQSGFSQAEATARFQELAHAYEVLSDPKERAWYDSHRSQILFSDPSSTTNSAVPDLFSFFSSTAFSGYSNSGRGFYKVYSDLFGKVYANEIDFARKLGLGLDSVREAPVMGDLESPYAQVTAFYNYWLGFSTVRKKEEERERKRALERERLEKLRDYVEPDSSKQEVVQLIKRFGAYLTIKISKLLPISLQNLDSRSVGAIAGLAVAIVFTWRLLRSPSQPQRRQPKRQAGTPSSSGANTNSNPGWNRLAY
ncbi:DNAJ protein JJJ1 homolog [Carya illinoinensis]|uniref:DNAJ protein JJJ1 homolog n=1 Tax=Carya illinoinensis TaxID=32201 RepID=UPI001C727BF3|nr:DNAJ protein JJJ1 homolog [Carya illinoinensis]